jgi:hypothetical protein
MAEVKKEFKNSLEEKAEKFGTSWKQKQATQQQQFAQRVQVNIAQQIGSQAMRITELTTANEIMAKQIEELKARVKELKPTA